MTAAPFNYIADEFKEAGIRFLLVGGYAVNLLAKRERRKTLIFSSRITTFQKRGPFWNVTDMNSQRIWTIFFPSPRQTILI